MINKFLSLLLILQTSVLFSQDIPIGTWQDHLPYSDAISVSEGSGVVYCATNSAVFTYNKSDFTVERLNLVTGLSDIGLSKIKYNEYNKRVIIAYTNGNIDILDENKNISNLSFIKNSNIIGSKSINHIYIVGKLAYLSTGFGIVVLDTDKLEIVDTYLFGPLGNFIVTNSVTMDNVNIYAATDQGVFFAPKNNPNLVDYNNWSLLSDLGALSYNNIVTFSNRLFINKSSSAWNSDTLLYNDLGVWQRFLPNGINLQSITTANNTLIVTTNGIITTYNSSLVETKNIYTVNGSFSIAPKEATIDSEGIVWYAENSHGLIKSISNWNSLAITPRGPSSPNVFNMDFVDGNLWKVSGGYNNSSFTANYDAKNLVNFLINNAWGSPGEYIKNVNDGNAADAVNVAINPNNTNQVFIGTWGDGLFELNNHVVTKIYTAQNSPLDSTFFGSTGIGSMAFDNDNMLWVASSGKQLNAFAQNDWFTFTYPNTGGAPTSLVIDNDKNKWVGIQNKNTIVVYNDRGTFNDASDDDVVLLTSGGNDIPGAVLYSLAVDLDGELWVGTDEGIAVFYNSSTVFSENIKAERVYIQQDGQTQILLETEAINVIKIDGANRKWIGTQNSGVYLMSEDGTEEISHFTSENSPLFSNNIFDIEINPKTGEVFIGTEKGLISYKGTATEPDTDFKTVFVYPNPVKPDFIGTIAIRGLVKDTDVRITDISGNIVYQTTSLGGQAIWDGKDFNGNKVHTGVYMIFNGSREGDLKAVAKILFIH